MLFHSPLYRGEESQFHYRTQVASFISPVTTPARPSSSQSPLPTPTPAVRIEATSPRDGAGDVSRRTTLVIRFSGAVDHLDIERRFTIRPAIKGAITWQDQVLTFTPAESWLPGTTYRVEVRDLGRMSFTIRSLVRDNRTSYTLEWGAPITMLQWLPIIASKS